MIEFYTFFSGAGTSAEISGIRGVTEKREKGGGEVSLDFKGIVRKSERGRTFFFKLLIP